jgi:hypothetical protein
MRAQYFKKPLEILPCLLATMFQPSIPSLNIRTQPLKHINNNSLTYKRGPLPTPKQSLNRLDKFLSTIFRHPREGEDEPDIGQGLRLRGWVF